MASAFERLILAWGEDRGQRSGWGLGITPDLSPTRGIPTPGVFHQEVTGPNRSGEVFSSRKLLDLLAGEIVGSFPDRGFRNRVVEVGDASRSRHSDFPLRLRTLSAFRGGIGERRTMMKVVTIKCQEWISLLSAIRAFSPHTHLPFRHDIHPPRWRGASISRISEKTWVVFM